MTAIALNELALKAVKRALLPLFPGHKSAHLTEALAYGLGFATYAALLSHRHDRGDFPDFALLDGGDFLTRLGQLAGRAIQCPRAGASWFENAVAHLEDGSVRPTASKRGRPLERDHTRRRWIQAEILTAATNEALRRKIFSLIPNDNRWPVVDPMSGRRGLAPFPFSFGDFHGFGRISDAGFAELNIQVAVSTTRLDEFPGQAKSPRSEPNIIARGGSWIERERGHWIQDASHELYLRQSYVSALEKIKIRPAGFAKRGAFIM